jgi:hypothetical protein
MHIHTTEMRYCVIAILPHLFFFFCGKQYVLSRKCRKTKRRKLPLKISRLFEHGQNITSDITFLLSSFCSRAIQTQLFLGGGGVGGIDLSFPLVIFCHSISLRVLNFLLTPYRIMPNTIFCKHQRGSVTIYFSSVCLLIGEDINTFTA